MGRPHQSRHTGWRDNLSALALIFLVAAPLLVGWWLVTAPSSPTSVVALAPLPTVTAPSAIESTRIAGGQVAPVPEPPVPGTTPPKTETPEDPPKRHLVIAWQPSHQGDTGSRGWKEYKICGDIVDRAIGELPEFQHVKAWDTKHGLTGSNNYRPQPTNTKAFDRELALGNNAKADIFISIHNDGAAPSGVLGEYIPGDKRGAALCRALVRGLVKRTDLEKNRGLREVRLYSLEKRRNGAKYRCLLEVGDNAADRTYLESKAGRQEIAEALATAIRGFEFD